MDVRSGVERGRRGGGMPVEGAKWEGTELFGLPPRKRFKVMEQQRRQEVQEEAPTVLDSHCSDITNVMPPHRASPKELTSQGFLVVEKQKYKLQQQKLQENLVLAMPPLPSRPVAVKRKEAPALPLPAPPTMKLKFQEEKVHSPSSSAFKNWGSPSLKDVFKPQLYPVVPEYCGKPREAWKDPGPPPKQLEQESLRAPSSVEHPKTWTMAKGSTCSINKAQEDVEMLVCEAPVSSLDMCSSDEDVIVSPSSTSSAPMEVLDLNVVAEVDDEIQISSDDNTVEASQITEVGTMAATVPFAPMEIDVMNEVQGMEDPIADLGSSEPLDVIHGSHAPFKNTAFVIETAHADITQVDDDEEIVKNIQQMDGPTLQTPVDETDLTGAEESKVVDVSETSVEIQEMEEEPKADLQKATLALPEARSSHLSSPLAAGSSNLTLVENYINSKTSNISEVSKDMTTAAACKEEDTVLTLFEKATDETYSARKDEEQGAQVLDESEEQKNQSTMATTTLRGSFVVTEERDEKEIDMERDNLLATIDERAEKLFKRMFEREDYNDEDHSNVSSSQLFFASNGVNNFNSLVLDMETDGVPTSIFRDLDEASTHKQKNGDGRGADVSSLDEDHQIDMEKPIVYVPNKLHKEMTSEMQESFSTTSEGLEDSDCSENQENDDPTSDGLEQMSTLSQEIVCKSSKEDSGWDMEMEIPNFGFGKRSGMTQRVKAPGRWLQSFEPKASAVDGEADEEADEDEGACDVCRSADAKPSDPIVLCDGCDIPVHADCYGNPLSHGIPEGDWFCAQCQSQRPDSRNCCLCPRSGGVMKMTTDGNWAHLSCAVFVPEVFFHIADDMEGIDTSQVPSKRYLAKCCVCNSIGGACVDCSEIGCKSRFHVSCALKEDLAMEFRNGRCGAIVISFCQQHTAAWDEQQERKGRSKYKIVSRESEKTKVAARAKSR